jgi:hypothetical protein
MEQQDLQTAKSDYPELRILQMQEYILGNHRNLISIQSLSFEKIAQENHS